MVDREYVEAQISAVMGRAYRVLDESPDATLIWMETQTELKALELRMLAEEHEARMKAYEAEQRFYDSLNDFAKVFKDHMLEMRKYFKGAEENLPTTKATQMEKDMEKMNELRNKKWGIDNNLEDRSD